MENIKVDIVSRETLKPSTPTPHHLRSHKFSFLDQLAPLVYAPLIFFYPRKDGPSLLPRLKESLPETLTKFYPLAGRIKDNFTINCNDEGALYLEARVNCAMLDFLKEPSIELLGDLVPEETTCMDSDCIRKAVQIMIQVTSFQCGGITIGVSNFHKILDGASAQSFMKCWAALTRREQGGEAIADPDFNTGSSLFPAKDLLSSHFTYVRVDPVTVVCKKFVFDASAIRKLKEKTKGEQIPNPSRVEALSGLIWKHAVLASNRVNSGHKKPSLFVHSVNMRTRSIPPLPAESIGNMYSLAPAQCDQIEKDDELHVLARKVREAITKVNDESIKELQSEEGFMKSYKAMANNPMFKNTNKYWCTSLCRIGFNELDFGWGIPVWICPPVDTETSLHRNQIMLIGYEDDGRIEAWMVLDQREMAVLELDEEFLAFASPK